MGSHTTWNGIPLVIGKGGIRFSPKPNRFARCIGKHMRGQTYANRAEVAKAFESAAHACKSRSA